MTMRTSKYLKVCFFVSTKKIHSELQQRAVDF